MIAIIITIMVLEIKVPHGADIGLVWSMKHTFISYILSFIYVGIYWNNHHHLFQLVQKVNGPVLWANLHLLFWLSLIPFCTGWMGEYEFAPWPVALYGLNLLFCGIAFTILTRLLIQHHGQQSNLARAIGRDGKGLISVIIYALAIPFSFWNSWISYAAYASVALIWLIPDRRVERELTKI